MSTRDAQESITIWDNIRRAWAEGNLERARNTLSNLIESTVTNNADTWRLWGDTAAALGDLHLAVRAYERAHRCASFEQSTHKWRNRYLYARLQTSIALQEIQDEYSAAPTPAADSEERLIGLALNAELYYRLGDLPQAALFGEQLLKEWLAGSNAAFEFLPHVQNRIWLTLARLAEESGDVPAALQFLLRLDDSGPPDPSLQPIAQLLSALLDYQPGTANDRVDRDIQPVVRKLYMALSTDVSTAHPPIPAALIASLDKTMAALQAESERPALLDEAVKLRPTNMLAQHLYEQERMGREGELERVLVADAYCRLTASRGRYQKTIARFLARPTTRKDAEFSFVALGGGDQVGGSAYLINLNGTRLLLDIGLDVATSPLSSYQRFKHALAHSGIVNGLADLDAVIVSHAHLDHVGLLPALYADPDLPRSRVSSGYCPSIPFYASEATREVARLMLEDAARLMAKEAEPLYGLNAVVEALGGVKPLPSNGLLSQFHNLGYVELMESGHILGSRMIFLERDGFRVLYTGDFNTLPQLTLPASASLKGLQPDVLIMESTYGYASVDWTLPREWVERAFIAGLDRVLRRGGIVLLPAFAVGRSQEVLGLVAEHARRNPDLPYTIYLDGLSRAVTHCYDRFSSQLTTRYRDLRAWVDPRLCIMPDDADREALMRKQILGRPNVVIASSGMLKKGSLAYQYALSIVDDPRNAIFYTGYLAEDSEAIDFLVGEPSDLVDIQCEQRRFSFSAHAPKKDLLQFVLDVQPRAVILVHGDAAKEAQVPDNLYALLRGLESDSFRVFLGREGHPLDYSQGRFCQK